MEEGFTSTLTDTSNRLNERFSAETKFQSKKSEATFRVRLQCQSQAQKIGALGSGCRSADPRPRWWTCSGGSSCSLQLVLQQRQRSEQLWGKAWLWPAPSETLSSGGSWRPTRTSVCIVHMIAEDEDNHELCDHNVEVKYVSRGNSHTIMGITADNCRRYFCATWEEGNMIFQHRFQVVSGEEALHTPFRCVLAEAHSHQDRSSLVQSLFLST